MHPRYYLDMEDFVESNVAIGAGQDEYRTIHAHRDLKDQTYTTTFKWTLTLRQRLRVLFKGEIWHEVQTFGYPFQPQRLSICKPSQVKYERE